MLSRCPQGIYNLYDVSCIYAYFLHVVAQVACHDMFKLMDRESLIEGLEPKGDAPQSLDAGTIEFKDVKFFYPFRPEIQVRWESSSRLYRELEPSSRLKRCSLLYRRSGHRDVRYIDAGNDADIHEGVYIFMG